LQILDEIGIEMGDKLAAAPRVPNSVASSSKDDDVEAILRRLKAD
jgi:hypothetical protein